MHISRIRIENYKAISLLELTELSDFVLVAGPNGIGKSCLLDAIRILKSHHGGYVPNEIDQLYGELQLDTTDPQRLRPLFRRTDRPILIEASFTLVEEERKYIRSNSASLLNDFVWRQRIGRQTGENTAMYQQRLLIASSNQELVRQIDEEVSQLSLILNDSLDAAAWTARLSITYGGIPVSESELLIRVLFALYAPTHVGVIDYHSANRNYAREAVGGYNVNFASAPSAQAKGEQALYNTSGKYQNIKAEMIDAYVRELIRKDVGLLQEGEQPPDLASSLTQLFKTFFPDKSFEGMKMSPAGVPEFPVTVRGGTHDLNELSSGEKEILFGYLRLRTSTPQNSIILMDEPELHLNPALLSGLPNFYNTHIGKARNNQLILVTHSDAILRPVVGSEDYMIVHLSPPSDEVDGVPQNQASLVSGEVEFERMLIALVGDVATYKPDAKYLLVEGGDNTGIDAAGFDRQMITALFPEFARRVNILGGGERAKVERLLELLEDDALKEEFGHRLFAIVDHDSFDTNNSTVISPNYSRWNRYHIENYLLEDDAIARVVARITMESVSPGAVAEDLKVAAAELVENLAFQATRDEINRQVVSTINLGRNSTKGQPSELLMQTLTSSMEKLSGVVKGLDQQQIGSRFASHEARYAEALRDETWRSRFPGREILKRYVKKRFASRLGYEYFRNSIISDMAEGGFRPEGMRLELAKVDAISVINSTAIAEAVEVEAT